MFDRTAVLKMLEISIEHEIQELTKKMTAEMLKKHEENIRQVIARHAMMILQRDFHVEISKEQLTIRVDIRKEP